MLAGGAPEVIQTTEPTDSEKLDLIRKILANRQFLDPVLGRLIIFDDDDTTVLLSAAAFEDAAGTIPYRGRGLERVERLA